MLRYGGLWNLLGFGYWAVEEKASGRFVGDVGFGMFQREIVPSYGEAPEAGWVLAPWCHGQGLCDRGGAGGARLERYEPAGPADLLHHRTGECRIEPRRRESGLRQIRRRHLQDLADLVLSARSTIGRGPEGDPRVKPADDGIVSFVMPGLDPGISRRWVTI